MDDEDKFMYEKAIEGRQHHQQNFNHWVNMYAIFNGALFVGLYNLKIKSSDYELMKIVILFLGCISGWSWHFSSRGFYDWILSWVKVVKKREEKLDSDGKKYVVYRAYYGKKTTSTQKVTITFSLMISLAWSLLTTKFLTDFICEKVCLYKNEKCGLALVIFFIILLCALLLYVWTLESDFPTEEID